MRRAILFTALILLAAFVLSGFSSQEIVVGRRRAVSGGSPALVTQCAGGSFGNSTTTTCYTTGTTKPSIGAGTDVLVLWVQGTSHQTVTTPSGCGATWSIVGSIDPTVYAVFYIGTSPTPGTCTLTETSSGDGTSGEVDMYMWDTSGTLSTVDGTPGYASTSFCTSCSGASTTSSNDGGLALGVVRGGNLTGWTSPSHQITGISEGGVVFNGAWEVQGTHGAKQNVWTSSGSAAYNAIIIMRHS